MSIEYGRKNHPLENCPMSSLIDFETLEKDLDLKSKSYLKADPFEHIVLDNFLTSQGLQLLHSNGFHRGVTTTEQSSDFMFAKNKMENPKLEEISEATCQLRDDLLSDRFRNVLRKIVGIDLFLDDSFTGGGLHQGGEGSFLEMHADFTRHPAKTEWIRELNILLYLNPEYQEAWGGHLDLEHKDTGTRASIAPEDNRLVVMLTKPHTLHGYKKITFPKDRLRTSIAAYAYTLDDGTRNVQYASTTWRPQGLAKRAFAKFWNPLVVVKQKLLGSRTAKRAKRD